MPVFTPTLVSGTAEVRARVGATASVKTSDQDITKNRVRAKPPPKQGMVGFTPAHEYARSKPQHIKGQEQHYTVPPDTFPTRPRDTRGFRPPTSKTGAPGERAGPTGTSRPPPTPWKRDTCVGYLKSIPPTSPHF